MWSRTLVGPAGEPLPRRHLRREALKGLKENIRHDSIWYTHTRKNVFTRIGQ
jgi:hypothetical protein